MLKFTGSYEKECINFGIRIFILVEEMDPKRRGSKANVQKTLTVATVELRVSPNSRSQILVSLRGLLKNINRPWTKTFADYFLTD